ncbi:MAG: hypothetical protein DMG24_10475 [Acidobacteria bacterium]|nr:MAG: hypothetical protein DMG24_10475 [Acidobacteriota bacterium]
MTGIIHHVEKEPDDDEHIQLQLHLQFEDLLNDRNRTGRQGCLVLEPDLSESAQGSLYTQDAGFKPGTLGLPSWMDTIAGVS